MSIEHIFRAYDIRGIVDEDLTDESMEKIAKAFGTFIKSKGARAISVGGDIRGTTPRMMTAFMKGIASVGLDVQKIERSPLGVTLFNSFQNELDASAFITASHLPPEWNGIKFYWGKGIGFSPEENEEIKRLFFSEEFSTGEEGTITEVDPYPKFVEYLRTKFDPEIGKKYTIAVDCGNGATSLVIPQLYEDLGFNVKSIFDTPDPTFPNRTSEPNEKSLAQLGEFVKENDVLFGAGFDGDGDRCVFTDENGRVISSDAFGIIASRYFMETGDNNRIVINMECSLAMEKQLKEMGAEVKRIRVGHSFLSLEAEKLDAVWCVEASGHAVAPMFFLFDDALILPLVLTLALDRFQKPFSELVDEIKMPLKKRFDIKCPDNIKFRVVEELANTLKTFEGEFSDLDGVALSTDKGRVLIRVSNTSPKVRVTVESMSESDFKEIENRFVPLVNEKISELEVKS